MDGEIEIVNEVTKTWARKTFPFSQSRRKASLISSFPLPSSNTQPQMLLFSKTASSPTQGTTSHKIPVYSGKSSSARFPKCSRNNKAKMSFTETSSERPEKWFGVKTYSRSEQQKLSKNLQPSPNSRVVASSEEISKKSENQGTTKDLHSNIEATSQVVIAKETSNISLSMANRSTAVERPSDACYLSTAIKRPSVDGYLSTSVKGPSDDGYLSTSIKGQSDDGYLSTSIKRPSDDDYLIPKKVLAASKKKTLLDVVASLNKHIGSAAPSSTISEKRPLKFNVLDEKENLNAQASTAASQQQLSSAVEVKRVFLVQKKDLEKLKDKIVFPNKKEKSVVLQPAEDGPGKTVAGSSMLKNIFFQSSSESAHPASILNASEINNKGKSQSGQSDLKEFATKLSILSQNLNEVYRMIPDSTLNEDLGGELLILGVELMMSIQSIGRVKEAIIKYLNSK